MIKRQLTCIGCPLGCALTAVLEDGAVVSVEGNTCRQGEIYAQKECTHPTRIVTSTLRVTGGDSPVASVKTSQDIPQNKVFACVQAIKKYTANAPVTMGQILIHNVAGTQADVVATREICRKGL